MKYEAYRMRMLEAMLVELLEKPQVSELPGWPGARELQFNLDDWVGLPPRVCGTQACVIGHAGTRPEFKAEGLELLRSGNYSFTPTYRGQSHWAAVTSFFGLSQELARELFLSSEYDSTSEIGPVLERLRAVIEAYDNLTEDQKQVFTRYEETSHLACVSYLPRQKLWVAYYGPSSGLTGTAEELSAALRNQMKL